jgi:hypothetical protein
MRRPTIDAFPTETNGPRRRRRGTSEAIEQRRLTRAIRSDDSKYFAGPNLEADLAERVQAAE